MDSGREASTAGKRSDPAWAWAAYEPDAARPWDLQRAAHLYRRAAFGATWPQLQRALKEGPARTIDRLLRPDTDPAPLNRDYDAYEETAVGPAAESAEPLAEWWLRRLIDTPHPLLERLTLFWHSFFGVTNARVQKGILLVRHVRTLRQHALGRFGPLLEAVVRDPAALLSAGAAQSYKGQPNESFPRAVLDVYTLGPGVATAADLRDAARAFAGLFVIRGELRANEYEKDAGDKRILGQTGPWAREDVVRLALARPETGRRLARQLYRGFVSETDEPTDTMLAPLVAALGPDYDVGRAAALVLRSNLFFSPAAYRRRVKSPVDYALGIIKALEGVVPTRPLAAALADLGQSLGSPPTVHGWEGGRAWLTPHTLIGRSNLAEALLSGGPPYGPKLNPAAVARKHAGASPAAARRLLLDLFLQGDVPPAVRARLDEAARGADDAALRRYGHTLVTLPESQLT